MSKIYLLKTENVKNVPETYCLRHFPDRYARSQRYRFEQDRLRCLGAGILLHEVTGIDESDLTEGKYGKPLCKKLSCGFNLSHSGDFIILAVGAGQIGTDIERHDREHMTVAKRVFTPGELAWYEEDCSPERFFRLWTLKESAIKTLGTGLSMDPATFSVYPFLNGQPVTVGGMRLYGRSLEIPGYSIALCSDQYTEQEPELLTLTETPAPDGSI